MKRSRINDIMAEAEEIIKRHGFALPPFAHWTPDQFRSNADLARNIIQARCGWDITDYGAGNYDQMGLFLFTLRNGRLADLKRGADTRDFSSLNYCCVHCRIKVTLSAS